MKQISFKETIKSYFNKNKSKNLAGLSYSSDALYLSSIDLEQVLIIVNNNNEGRKLKKELLFFKQNLRSEEIIFIPETEDMPFDFIDSDKYLSSKKNLNLIKYINSKKKYITVITTIKNLQQKILPKEVLKKELIEIYTSIIIDLEEFKKKLIKLGYINSYQVNFVGEFSIRGSIVDLYPGGYKNPIRLDLNDIHVDSIKYFDAETQITNNIISIDQILIVPINNVIFDDEKIKIFRKKYREIFDGNPNNNKVYCDVSNKILPQGFNNYFPLLYENSNSIFDYINKIDNIIIYNNFANELKKNNRKIIERYDALITQNENILNYKYLYINDKNIEKIVFKKNTIVINSEKVSDNSLYHYNISAIQDISFKPYLDFPLKNLKNYIKNNFCTILCIDDEKKITQLIDIFSTYKLNFQVVQLLDEIDFLPNNLYIMNNFIEESFKINDLEISFVKDSDILKEKIKQKITKKKSSSFFFIDQLKNLDMGSPIVHDIHGIGRYDGLKYLEVNGISNEYLTILYADNDKLYVPVSSLDLVNKYHSSNDESAPLHKLGGHIWSNAKKKANKKAYDIAIELLEIQAKRVLDKTISYSINEFEYSKFSNEFIYDETEDQLNAINDVINDLSSDKLMDRLICGDVGFGKTEIALRAAFITVSNYKQVVIIVPTTLLAEQHEKTFKERFKNWPFKIRCLSRFRSNKEKKEILSEIITGDCNIIIGTHSVIQNSVKYKSLGLLIIDEEQKFGVRHKEFLKKLKNHINVLTLTATPIPRTLNMSLGGLRDLSIIATSPINRLPIKTYISNWDKLVIKEACEREINRGGQIFFLHNKISDIELVYNEINKLLPKCSIKVAHAKISSSQLEKIILDFYNKKFSILISTTIIENGIDIPNANTIIINRADKFGLSQLHQIRGRVGRTNRQAFCYLIVSDKDHITENAKKRLQALENMEDLGSGFSIASRDLEIRGAGELLGENQSGEIQEIGFSLYNKILSKAITSIKAGEMPNSESSYDSIIEIDLNEIALIPENYINDINLRLIMYKKISNCETLEHLENISSELLDRFGNIPEETINLLDITKIKLKYSEIGIRKITFYKNFLKIQFNSSARINHDKLMKFIKDSDNNISLTKENELIYKKIFNDLKEKKNLLESLVKSIT